MFGLKTDKARQRLPFIAPVRSQFDPDDVPVLGLLPGSAVVAEPAPVGHSDVQAVGVESCRTRLTAEQLPSCNTKRKANKAWEPF